ncbi:MAG: multicopper oxidase domain-containing protein, partial [Verrucomicrobiales bacterium]|nr:multicopper oxidase domain-containing protein [Verrucomicrobiales bacterium]
MNERQILSSLCLAATVWLGGLDTSQAAAFGPAAGVNYDLPNFANSPLPTVNPNGTVSGGLRKFVDGLPGLGAGAANNLGQYIPVAAPDITSYPGSDYYEIALVEYREQMHSDLGGGTRLRGYVQIYPPGTTGSGAVQLNYPNGSPITVGGQPVYAHAQPHYLGPLIQAWKDRPTRIKFYNLLPTGAAGRLFIPVDTTIMGAGEGGWALDENGNQVFTPGGMFTENRATLHLHGGNTPWISDGTPHQWTVPAGEATPYKKGVASVDVPDMSSGEGSMTFYYPNQQSGRLMFYHDHSYGITRLNVYAGEAAGYLLVDPAERDLTNGNTPGIPAMPDIPLVIEDKTFVWGNAGAGTGTYEVDPTWAQVVPDSQPGDLWFPHVYMANQDPTAFDGFNPVGRWDYGAWFWPVFPSLVPPAITSTVPESFMDTMTVNGTAYPTVTVNPQAYRFRILDASNDRFVNLSLWVADPLSVAVVDGGSNYSPSPTVTITDPTGTGATASAYVYGGVIQEIMISGTPVNYSHPVITINDTSGTGAKVVASANTELKMVYLNRSQNRITPFPTHWYDAVLDDRDGGVPHPATRGPAMIQIGTEGGLLPAPAVVLNQPVNFDYDRRSVTVLNVLQHALFLGPAERADVIIDFTPFAGKTLILYNDSPAPVPAADPRVDYYTGNPDQVASGGAPTTLPGYGPNTRTIMQIKVGGSGGAAPVDSINSTILSTLQAALPAAFAATQEKPIIPEPTYPIASGGNSLVATYSRIANNNLSFTPVSELKVGGNVIPAGTPTTVPLIPKAIQELFDPYGRMNSILGTELPFTTALNQTTIPLAYIDPTTETIPDGETQFWKITHNGVDTHAIHFHLVNVQIINRIGWDNAVKPPEENELGWKDTVRMNPLEDIVVAATAKAQRIPWVLPNSVRPLDVTQPLGSSLGFTQVNPLTGGNPTPNPIVNRIEDFAWEYVWHCHILGHEEDDMMRPLVMPVTGTDYVMDQVAPTVTITLAPPANPSGWNNTDVAVSINAVDGPLTPEGTASGLSSISYGATGANSVANTTTPVLTSGINPASVNVAALTLEGDTTVSASAKDHALNTGSALPVVVKIDKTAPSTTATLAGTTGQNGYYTSDVTVTLAATDAASGVASISYSVDGGGSTGYSATFVVTGDGIHTVTLSSTDVAGNIETGNSITIKIDAGAPTISVVATPAANVNGWNNSNVDLAFSASDAGSGVASITYNDGSAPTTVNAATANLTLSAEGTTSVAFFATDTAGSSSASQSITVKIDKTAPSTAASLAGTAGSNGYYTTDVSVTLNATDAGSGVA